MGYGNFDQSIISPGGYGGFGGGFGCGGPMWLLLGLLFARGGFGGFCGNGGGAGGAAFLGGEFNSLLSSLNSSRAETIGAVSSSRAETLSAIQGVAESSVAGRMEGQSSLKDLLMAVFNGNTNVKEQVLGALSTTSAENRGLFKDVFATLCGLEKQGVSQTNAIMQDLNGVSSLITAQFNCVDKQIATLSCNQGKIIDLISRIVPDILNNLATVRAQEKADMLAARVAQLEAAATQAATDNKLNLVLNLLGSTGGLPVKA